MTEQRQARIAPDPAAVELRGVVKHWTSGPETVRAVDGVSLSAKPGEFIAICGPSGSGKTTLLLLAGTVLQPDAGSVYLCGRDMSTLADAEATDYQRKCIGYVHQRADLMPGVPAVDNAALKLLADGCSLREARDAARSWLSRLGLDAQQQRLTPDKLSGGQAQRVAIAGALVNDPDVILADEPTGSLDSQSGAQMLQLLDSVRRARDMAIVLVTHDPQAARLADRVCTLVDGQLHHASADDFEQYVSAR